MWVMQTDIKAHSYLQRVGDGRRDRQIQQEISKAYLAQLLRPKPHLCYQKMRQSGKPAQYNSVVVSTSESCSGPLKSAWKVQTRNSDTWGQKKMCPGSRRGRRFTLFIFCPAWLQGIRWVHQSWLRGNLNLDYQFNTNLSQKHPHRHTLKGRFTS